ncbi:MAG: permease, partial [Xanthobacteraceae bacterium]
LFAFGALFGFAGLMLAVPLAASVGVLTRFAIRQYLASPLYTGVPRVRSHDGSARPES